MKVVYTAPNRAHHYFYAKSLHEAGILKAFVSGFSRFSPRAKLPELGSTLKRVDFIQNVFLATLKFKMPDKITDWFAYWAKLEQDYACKKYIDGSDIFLFYNGSGLKSCLYAKKKGVVTIVEVVNTHVEYQEKILEREYKKLNLPFTPFNIKEKQRRVKEYEEADYIMYPSEFVKKSFLEYGFAESKLIKVPYGFNAFQADNTSRVSKTQSSFVILYVGSISVRKGIRYLLQAFEKLDKPGKKLVIVGPSSEQSGFADIKIPENVKFTGPLKGKELEEIYKSADVFCLPSIEDGFGLVVGEALSYGVPVITTNNTGAIDIIKNSENGFVVTAGNAEAIFEKLQLLANDATLLTQMKECAVATSRELKGWETCKEELISALYRCKKLSYDK